MNSFKASLVVFLLLSSLCTTAKEVTDTLYSAQNDRIIVTYSLTQKGNKVDLEFRSVRKLLGDQHRRKYKKEADRVHTLFFDWIGVRKDMEFSGEITPSAISLPANASYKSSSDGYFVAEQRPSLSFELEATTARTLTIPLYLAHYEGKRHYKILCSCGSLEVHLAASTSSTNNPTTTKRQNQQSNVELIESEEEFDELDDQALKLINSINAELPKQDTLPMASTLERKVENLVDLQSKIKNDNIVKKIDETLEAYNDRKKELEKKIDAIKKQQDDDMAFNNCNTKEQYELYMKQHPNGSHVEEAKAKIDESEAKAKEEEKSKKKRNIWMIIGGILLAILLFVGNQVMQSFRNIRTQRSMMQMQQDAAKRAQNMARSKAKSEIRKQTNKVTSQIKKKGQTALRDTANKVKNNNGNSRLSI